MGNVADDYSTIVERGYLMPITEQQLIAAIRKEFFQLLRDADYSIPATVELQRMFEEAVVNTLMGFVA